MKKREKNGRRGERGKMRERERGRRERGGRASEIREWGVTERRLEGGMSTAAAIQYPGMRL